MMKRFEMEGFTLTELLVTMSLFSLVMTVVMGVLMTQLRALEQFEDGIGPRDLFWHHLEVVSLQAIGIHKDDRALRLTTAAGKTYEFSFAPLALREVQSGIRWEYPFQADVSFTAVTNDSRAVLVCQIAGAGFDEKRVFALGWQKGEK